MAISDIQKVDYLWKKVGFGASKTDVNSVKLAVNEAIPSPLLLRGDKLWADSALIPAVIPSSTTSLVTVYSDASSDSTVETVEDTTSSTRRTWKTNITDWIPPELGSTYQVKIYIDDALANAPQTTGEQVFASGSGNNDEWFFDYQSGIINFIGTNLPSGLTAGKKVYVSGAQYNGGFGINSQEASFGNISISENTIEATDVGGSIILSPNGNGIVNVTSPLNVTELTVNGSPVSIDDLSDGVNVDSNLGLGENTFSDVAFEGTGNVAVGNNSQSAVTTGTNNTTLGDNAGSTITQGSNNIVIGSNAQPTTATVSNEITIGNAQSNKFRLPGVTFFIDNGDVLIGTEDNLLSKKLQVSGSADVTGTLTATVLQGTMDGGFY